MYKLVAASDPSRSSALESRHGLRGPCRRLGTEAPLPLMKLKKKERYKIEIGFEDTGRLGRKNASIEIGKLEIP